jgi:hypothetical protein
MIAAQTLVAVLLAHLLGDFVLQPRSLALAKSKNLSALVWHCSIVGLCLFFIGGQSIKFVLVNTILHGLIDGNIWRLYGIRIKKRGDGFHYWNDYWFYTTIGFDQFLHMTIMVLSLKMLA